MGWAHLALSGATSSAIPAFATSTYPSARISNSANASGHNSALRRSTSSITPTLPIPMARPAVTGRELSLIPHSPVLSAVVAPHRIMPRLILCSVPRSEEHTSELQSRLHLVCRLLLEKQTHGCRSRVSTPDRMHDRLPHRHR